MKRTNRSNILARIIYPLLVMMLMVGASGSPTFSPKPQNPPDTNFVITDTWAVEVQPGTDPDQLAAQMGANNLGPIGSLPNMYLFQIAGSDKQTSAAADVFAASSQVQWYQQQVARQQSKRAFTPPTDPLYVLPPYGQWHLTNPAGAYPGGANVINAWALGPTDAGYTGAGVTIGIVDDGFEYTHPDLSAHYVSGSSYDFNGSDTNPFPDVSKDFHGTAVAGVAGANRNTTCGVGVAYDANLASLRLIGGPSTDAMEAAALNYAYDTTSIYNNSWGPVDDGQNLTAPGTLTSLALQNGAANGRGGKGNIYVWAAGNGRADGPLVTDLIYDNVNYDGYANSRFTIAVGAVDSDGIQSYYSEPGAAMVVTAPSSSDGVGPNGISTTDLTTADGYNAGDCTTGFGGTSSSAPVVSGVVALMLQRNPNLGWRDVQNILIRTASKNNSGDSDWDANPVLAGVQTNGATGGGLHVNHKYGFGLVDAAAAVTMADPLTYVNLPSAPNVFSGVIPVNLPIPDADLITGVSSTFNVTQDITLEHVEVVFNSTHAYRGDLKVVLTAPSGTQSILAEGHNDSAANYNSWKFMTVRDWGESSLGNWTLKVTDVKGNDVGSFDSWQLNFYKEIKVANINVAIGGVNKGTYSLLQGNSQRVSYTGANNGPTKIVSTNGASIVSSTRVMFVSQSYSEMLGFPGSQLTNEYWFPVYNSTGLLASQLRVGNVGAQSTTITVYIGNNTVLDSFTLAANSAIRKEYTGTNNGPLHVVSSVTNIMTSMRYLYGGKSFSEELGFPGNQLTTEYWFPWYNNAAMYSELRVANTGNATADVTVYIGNNQVLDTFSINVGTAVRKTYAVNNGPLRVVTSSSTILPSIRVLFGSASYSEMLGLPTAKLGNEYWMPVYDSATNASQIRVGNVGNQSTLITIYAGSTKLDSFTLLAGGAIRQVYTGTNTGPLHVLSSLTNVLVSVRILYTTAAFQSFYELLGYPNSQLATDYYFPWYNNYAMESQLRFATP